MKAQTFVIKSFSDVQRVYAYLGQHHGAAAGDGKPLVVNIAPQEKQRSKDQNALYWLWMTKWGKHTGHTKDQASAHFKYVCLAKIYERDNVGMYRQTFKTMRDLKEEKNPAYESLRQYIADKISTTEANTKQFTEYLNDIHDWSMVNSNFYLEKPEDLMYVLE